MQQDMNPLEDELGELFVDRDKELNGFWQWAMRVPLYVPNNSHALIGRRRTGKTAILIKLYNRLFHEQDRVVPIFVSFARYLKRPEPQIFWGEFANEYLAGYLRSYLAFRYRQPDFVKDERGLDDLRPFIEQTQDELALKLLERYDRTLARPQFSVTDLAQWIVNAPRTEASAHNMPTVVIIDEFQILATAQNEERNLRWSVTSLFQNAVETNWAPILVSGSAVSTLVHQALGGALSGRFSYHFIEPLPHEHAYDLVFRLGKRYGVTVNEELAEAIWQVTGGYPYSIEALMDSASPARERYPDLAALDEVVAFEISDVNGKLRQHNYEEFEKYSHLLNSGLLTRKVMFWVTKYPDRLIDTEQIAAELGESLENVQASLKKLHQIDVISPVTLSRYNGPSDPMLRRYIEYHHYIEIEKLTPAEALKDWQAEYRQLQGRLNHFVGEVGEVYLHGVMQRFDGRTVEGATYFNQPGPIALPKFSKLERRGGIVKDGASVEIDILGETAAASDTPPTLWLVQVKYLKSAVGEKAVADFLQQCTTVLQQRPATTVVRWYFSKSGFTRAARKLLQTEGVLYNDLPTFNHLARLFRFFGLPEE
ncbi:MAG: hypothetical protein DYG89_29775 [Caldilinea sp. CFX5]|nr:hypothetical protein [Caldilinea sp. CFX5]